MIDGWSRKPGRPRKFDRGRINATTRMTPEGFADMLAEANANGRSMSEQIEYMIERCRAYDRLIMALMEHEEANRSMAIMRQMMRDYEEQIERGRAKVSGQ